MAPVKDIGHGQRRQRRQSIQEEVDLSKVRFQTYNWESLRKAGTVTLPLPLPLVEWFRGHRYGGTSEGRQRLAKHPLTERVLRSYVHRVRDVPPRCETRRELIHRLVGIVQELNYFEVQNPTMPPLQTLAEGEGVCRDTALLLTAWLYAIRHPSVLLYFPPEATDGNAGHLAAGIANPGGAGGEHVVHKGRKYFYVETTESRAIGNTILLPYDMEDAQVREVYHE